MLQATGVILSGGKSVRMGTDKAFLKIGRQLMIQRIAGELMKFFPEIIISDNNLKTGKSLGLPVIADRIDRRVPLCGVHAALYAAHYEYILVAACDMPFITGALARSMIEQAVGYDVAVPRHGSYLQPLFAAYRRSCLPFIERNLLMGKCKTDDFYKEVKVNYVDVEKSLNVDVETIFFNVNTPVDLRKAREMTEYKEVN